MLLVFPFHPTTAIEEGIKSLPPYENTKSTTHSTTKNPNKTARFGKKPESKKWKMWEGEIMLVGVGK